MGFEPILAGHHAIKTGKVRLRGPKSRVLWPEGLVFWLLGGFEKGQSSKILFVKLA